MRGGACISPSTGREPRLRESASLPRRFWDSCASGTADFGHRGLARDADGGTFTDTDGASGMHADLNETNGEPDGEPSSEPVAGSGAKSDELAPLVYSELRALAAVFMRGQSKDHTLQPTALVNEAYIRLATSSPHALRSRSHFIAVAAKAMRQVLINHAIAKKTTKRGGGAARVSLESVDGGAVEYDWLEILALHEALERLEGFDPRRAAVVEAKVFGGMTNEQVAEVLGVSLSTVDSDWRTARAWFAKEMRSADADPQGVDDRRVL